MKHKDKVERTSAEAAEELYTDKTLGIDVEMPAAEQAAEEDSEVQQLKKQLEEKAKQSDENYNKFLRMQAEFDNFRKRTIKEKEELYIVSLERVVTELLPIVDNMERAIAAFKKNGLENTYLDGVDMIQKQLFAVLEKNGLKEIEALGMDFDPNIHHAVMQVEGSCEEENKVKEVLQKGYFLGSKVLRPVMVQVVVNN
ncbi:MAG: nucleotide exchange factor GrpE [Clostridiales bacterium GWB2_37_7]|nr:MAG: nucleotide exchange factor GrpE [Clostridiales bacterium GWB2_37_7]